MFGFTEEHRRTINLLIDQQIDETPLVLPRVKYGLSLSLKSLTLFPGLMSGDATLIDNPAGSQVISKLTR